jgi:methionyl-tRNA formyltransferase
VTSLRVAFAGTPDFALPAFRALINSPHQVVGVLTQPDRPKGRGRQLASSPVKLAALEHGVPVSQPSSLKQEADRADLAGWQPDVLVVVAYGLILPRAVLDLPRLGCVNIHASLLPRWRGAAPIQRAILAGDEVTGVSIMSMDIGLDTGPVFLERRLSIEATDTGGSLHDRLAAEGAAALLEVLAQMAAGSAISTPQREDGVTYAAKIDKSEALINWQLSAAQIERQVRAFNPWPIAETRFEGEQLRVHGAHRVLSASVARAIPQASGAAVAPAASQDPGARPVVVPARDDAPTSGSISGEPGTIVAVHDGFITVSCGSGILALTEVQRPGRRPVAARDLINTVELLGRRLG